MPNIYCKELREQERLKSELQVAHRIQFGSLPKEVPVIAGLDIFATSRPAFEVGSDYYDFFQVDSNTIIHAAEDFAKGGKRFDDMTVCVLRIE